jgi:hypothetical protein
MKVSEEQKVVLALGAIGISLSIGVPVGVWKINENRINSHKYTLVIGDKEYINTRQVTERVFRLEDNTNLYIGENETFTLKEIK